jgi:multidrug efflux system outer membrane protein
MWVQTIHWQKLLQGRSAYWDMQLATSLPIFTGGLLEANLWGAEVDYNTAICKYNQLVLDAVKEVLNGVAILQNKHRQYDEFKSEVQQQEKIVHITQLRVEHNLASNLEYLNSQQETLVIRNKEMTALGEMVIAMLELIKALGGGYGACMEADSHECIF